MRGLIDSGTIRRVLALAAAPGILALASIGLATREASSAPPAPASPAEGLADSAVKDVAPPFPDSKPTPPPPHDTGKPDAPPLPWDAGKKPDASPPLPDARPIPPDPVPLEAEAIYVLKLRFLKGNVKIDKVTHQKLSKKSVLPRHFGRFAAELYVGPTLLERLRFDFPLVHDDVVGDAYEKGLDVSIDVKIPDSERPTRLEIWDRATDRRWSFPYPPK